MAKKRANGEGSIFQRPDGRWVERVSLGYDTVSHKRLTKTVYGKTQAEVRKKVTEALRKYDQGLTVHSRSQTVEQFLNNWLNEVAKPKVRPSTYRSYEQIVRNHLVPGLGKYTLEKLTPQVVQTYLNAKAETGISVDHLRRVLRAALSQAVKWDLVQRNACTAVSVPKKEKYDFARLDPDQARAFLEATGKTRYRALFTVAIAVGLRLGEALGLRWNDVDFETGTLYVRNQLQRVDGKLTLVEPKTKKAKRSIPLPAFAVLALREHRREQDETKLANSDVWQEMGFVFASSVGTPADPRNIRRTLSSILEDSGLPHLRFHDLRHTCATLLLAQGTDARTIMETLGHSQITLTLNTYAHVMPVLQRDAADRMEQMLGSAKEGV